MFETLEMYKYRLVILYDLTIDIITVAVWG